MEKSEDGSEIKIELNTQKGHTKIETHEAYISVRWMFLCVKVNQPETRN